MKPLRNRLHLALIALGFASAPGPAEAAVKAVASLPDIAWAMKEIGGEHVEVASLLKGTENPHYADAVPELIRQAARADVVCSVGLELEVGWLPKVLARSGNARVQPGGAGHCELGKGVKVLERPNGAVDRSMGDVHPMGNPHFWLSPIAFAQAAGQIAEAFSRVDPARSAEYRKGLGRFRATLEKIYLRNKARLAPIASGRAGPHLVEYHREFSYFEEAYGLKSFGSIEEKPGVPPSAGRIAEVAGQAKSAGVKLSLAAEYAPRHVLARFRELTGLPVLIVPTSIQPAGRIRDYGELQDFLAESIAKAFQDGALDAGSGLELIRK